MFRSLFCHVYLFVNFWFRVYCIYNYRQEKLQTPKNHWQRTMTAFSTMGKRNCKPKLTVNARWQHSQLRAKETANPRSLSTDDDILNLKQEKLQTQNHCQRTMTTFSTSGKRNRKPEITVNARWQRSQLEARETANPKSLSTHDDNILNFWKKKLKTQNHCQRTMTTFSTSGKRDCKPKITVNTRWTRS